MASSAQNRRGGIGCLRVMSHLCADRRGVGYGVTREMIESGFDKDKHPAFDRIPSSRLGVLPLVFRFVIPRRRSTAVFTARLGKPATSRPRRDSDQRTFGKCCGDGRGTRIKEWPCDPQDFRPSCRCDRLQGWRWLPRRPSRSGVLHLECEPPRSKRDRTVKRELRITHHHASPYWASSNEAASCNSVVLTDLANGQMRVDDGYQRF